MTPIERYTTPPPQPVDVSNPIWVARAWQWVFDTLSHLDGCMDDVKASVEAAQKDDGDLLDRIDAHQAFHDKMDAVRDAEKKQRDRWMSPFKKVLEETPKLVLFAISLAAGGVGAVIGALLG